MGRDVAEREVTDFVTFVARHARTRTSARREAAASIRRLAPPDRIACSANIYWPDGVSLSEYLKA
jgi:hypothetical protein